MRLGIGALATTTLFLVTTMDAGAELLTTKSFSVRITRHCTEGNVTCNNITYFGKNLKTGQSIGLLGKTMNIPCPDGVTPCHFLGYQFQNGSYQYFVRANGELQVYQGKKLLLLEKGTWSR